MSYQYFPNKQSILAELRQRYDERFLERVQAVIEGLDSLSLREAMREFVRFMIAIHSESPGLHNALAEQVPEWERDRLRKLAVAYLATHRDEVRREDLDLAARLSVEAGEALIHGTALRSPDLLRRAEFAEEVTDLLTRYLAK